VNGVIRERRQAFAKQSWEDFDYTQPVRLAFRELWRRLILLSQSHTVDINFLELHHHHDDYLERATVEAMQTSTFAPLKRLLEQG
jgi:hypothetical protein